MSDRPAKAPEREPDPPRTRFRRALLWPLLGVAVLWTIAGIQAAMSANWIRLGVFPRDPATLTGILTAPLIHESWMHLMANTPALLGLGALATFGYPRATRLAVPLIWLFSGIGVWLFARESFHIGISGLTHGLMFFIVVIGFLRRDPMAIALALVVFLVFGGMAAGIFPQEPGVSFEYHLFGALSGILCALMMYRLDPAPWRRQQEPPEEDESADAQTADGESQPADLHESGALPPEAEPGSRTGDDNRPRGN
ncbi:rhomboid family intramembrane serine protease [Thioalkalivibrio paradoxus]|uniref:Membrane protein n=1 Tax=Thioalkalivibrio paradoxus ARh 1 TaxID=713585 RepID=W0DJ66_9GAMM|nr:rhomboid family intramembrane serine protease [Thioalkalivibrio paradoxus]AHE97043.1 membrane protein [Thioalkalivibrio paradoxus ARh 1]